LSYFPLLTVFLVSIIAFRALTWLAVRNGMIQPVKMSDEVLAWLSIMERDANDLHMVQLMPLPPHHLLLH